MSGKQLKYVRNVHGFTVFPVDAGSHFDVSRGLFCRPRSAGFVYWNTDGLPVCAGRSGSLDLDSDETDTEALRAEWGMDTPAAPITLTPAMKADAALFEGEHFTVFATAEEKS
jgi:hypothetical protein